MTVKDVAKRYGVLAAGLAGILALHVISMPDNPRLAVCWLRRSTGIPCPTCGMTRAFAALAKGHFHRAIEYNPLSPLFAAVVVAGWSYASWRMIRGAAFPVFRGRRMIVIFATLGALAVGTWIVRVLVPLAFGLGGSRP